MIFVISGSLTLFINIVFDHLLLTRKRSIKYTSFIFIANYLLTLLGYLLSYTFFKDSIFYKYILSMVGFTAIIYIFLVFEESISKKLFTMFTIWLFSNITLILCSYIISLFSIKDSNLYIVSLTSLRIFIQLSFVPIIYLYFQQRYKEMLKLVSNKVINIISIYSIIIFLFLINYYYEAYSYKPLNFYGLFNSLLFIIIILLSYVIIFIAIWSVNKNMELEYKFKIIDAQIELQKQNYKTLNQSIENYYIFKHDIRHHLLAIKSMLDAKNHTAASEYLDKFNENELCQNIDIICKNFTIDSILKYYMGIAVTYNIDFKVTANIPQDLTIDNLDLSVVIGNCVENAFEACANIRDETKKYIHIKAEIKGSQLILKIQNSFNGQVAKDNTSIKSCKNEQGHGIGLSNVRKIAEKYSGYFNIKYTESEFEVHIIMNYN